MRSILLAASLALALAGAFAPAGAALPPGISGAWYNPAQPGHGFSIEMLEGDRALAFWYVFDPAGHPVHLYIEADVAGDTLQGEAYLGRGMRFGEFDPDDHSLVHWGEVDLAFTDCNQADLAWDADGPAGVGFGSGNMPLQRLTAIAGLACTLAVGEGVESGVYRGNLTLAPYGQGGVLHGFLDDSGRFFAAQETVGLSNAIPHGFFGAALQGQVVAEQPGAVAIDAVLRSNEWGRHWPRPADATRPPLRSPLPIDISLGVQASGDVLGTGVTRNADQRFEVVLLRDGASPRKVTVDTLADVAGSYNFRVMALYVGPDALPLTVAEDGTLCVADCVLGGQLALSAEGAPLTFSLTHADDPTIRYEGAGWLEQDAGGIRTLVLVGSNGGEEGFGIVAEAQ